MNKKLEAIRMVRNTNPVTPEILEEAAKLGMIPKKDLVSGRSYIGSCRNANIAEWDGKKQVFYYLRTKFGDTFAESIKHPEDDDGYDIFVPVEEIKVDFYD